MDTNDGCAYDYARVSEMLGSSMIAMHGIKFEGDTLIIPDIENTGTFYNEGAIRFDEIEKIVSGYAFIDILLRNGYKFSLLRGEAVKTCVNISNIK